MKKFYSLVCALAIVLSASAVPQYQAKSLKKQAAIEMAKFEKQAVKVQKQDKQAISLQAATREAAAVKRAPQAKQEATNINIGEYTETYYASDGDVYFKLISDDDNYYFYFDILVAEGDSDIVLGKTYGLSDMITNYSKGIDYTTYQYIVYDSVAFTKTITNDLVRIEAFVADAKGNEYNIVYQEKEFVVTGDTINVFFAEPMDIPAFYNDGTVELISQNDDYKICLCYAYATEGSIAGTFGSDDFDYDFTYINKLEVIDAQAIATEANNRKDVEAWLLASDGNVYHVKMFFIEPTAQNFATITATNLEVDDTYASWLGAVFVDASDANNAISLTLNATAAGSGLAGTYTIGVDANGTITDADNNETTLYSGTFTVAYNAGEYTVTGSVLGMNSTQYTLNLSYVKPAATSQETLNGAGYLYLEEYNGENYWEALAKNADGTRYISLLAFADAPAGSYATDDLYASYCYAGKFENGDTIWYNMIDANFTIAVTGETATLNGTFLAQNENNSADVVEFTLNLTLAVVDETGGTGSEYDSEEAFKQIFPSYEVDDQYLAKYNVLIVSAQKEDNSYISLEFNVEAGATELAAGVYSITDTYTTGTVSYGYIDGYIYGSFAGFINSNDQISIPLWLLFNGTVTVYDNGVIVVNAINTKGSQIECQLGQWPEGVENTEAEVVATKRIVNGQLVIEKNGVKYNAVGTVVK